MRKYIGRLAPSPSGHLHVGHAQTFYIAMKRCQTNNGELILRIEDLDTLRCKHQFTIDLMEDLRWFGINWTRGPSLTNPIRGLEYFQSNRFELYLKHWTRLVQTGHLYPCKHSRKDVERALSAPHEGDAEIVFPASLRPDYMSDYYPTDFVRECNSSSFQGEGQASSEDNADRPLQRFYNSDRSTAHLPCEILSLSAPTAVNWRFRVADGLRVSFIDECVGPVEFVAGVDFGDFIVWRADGVPSYDFACVVDDATMDVTEVVRGGDLLLSTARQLCLYYALGLHDQVPSFYHCPLVRDERGRRLAKRDDAKSLRQLRREGYSPSQVAKEFFSIVIDDSTEKVTHESLR